jgi:hypothetical protein
MSQLYDLNRMGECLKDSIVRLKQQSQEKYFEPDEVGG